MCERLINISFYVSVGTALFQPAFHLSHTNREGSIMARPVPAPSQLAILQVLWSERRPWTVREVLTALNAGRRKSDHLAYTTVLSNFQVMRRKQLVMRHNTRPHGYTPAYSKDVGQRIVAHHVCQTWYGGNWAAMAGAALLFGSFSSDELISLESNEKTGAWLKVRGIVR